MFGDESTVQIMLRWSQENEQAVRDVQARLAEVTGQIIGVNAANLSQIGGLLTAATGWAQVAVWAGVAAVVLAPIAALILSAAVALISFAAGAAATVAVMGAVVLGFGAIGAAVMLLGGGGGIGSAAVLTTATTQLAAAKQALSDYNQLHTGPDTLSQKLAEEDLTLRLAQAQTKYNAALAASQGPTGVLIAQLTQMKDTLALQAEPLAKMITTWVGGAVPAVTLLSQTIMTWFGERLPGVLRGISQVLKDLTPDFDNFGKFIGGVMDHVGPQIASVAEAFTRLALQGVQGLITNLVRMSDWFQKELPKLGPIVAQIFGAMGSFIQGVASAWAGLNDWIVKNWKQTLDDAKIEVGKLSDAFKNLSDPKGNFQTSLKGFQDFGKALKDISDQTITVVDDITKIAKALQPIADVLNAIESALNRNGLWIHNTVLAPIDRAGRSSTQNTMPPGGGRMTTAPAIHVHVAKFVGTITPAEAKLIEAAVRGGQRSRS
jgi:hypothetical protein